MPSEINNSDKALRIADIILFSEISLSIASLVKKFISCTIFDSVTFSSSFTFEYSSIASIVLVKSETTNNDSS